MSVRPVVGVDRRRVLKAAAWSAPVIAIAVAAPAAAASTTPEITDEFTIQSYGVTDQGWSGKPGPLCWSGGQINWASPSQHTATATITYAVTIFLPDGSSEQLAGPTSTVISPWGNVKVDAISWGTAPIPKGQYTVTLNASINGRASLYISDSVTVS